MAYAVDLAELLRRMADNVHQILKGAKPGDITEIAWIVIIAASATALTLLLFWIIEVSLDRETKSK